MMSFFFGWRCVRVRFSCEEYDGVSKVGKYEFINEKNRP